MSNMEVYGIDNMMKVVNVVVECGNVIPQVIAAKSLVGRITALGALTDELISLASLKPDMMKKEWADFSDDEKVQMTNQIRAKFDIENDTLEMVIEEAIAIAIAQIELGGKMIDLARKFKEQANEEKE